MVTLLYHSVNVGPVCRNLAAKFPKNLQAVHDTQVLPKSDIVLRWGSLVPATASTVLNTVEAVSLAKNKKASRKVLQDLSPKTWYNSNAIQKYTLPCVIRPKSHHAGHKFFLCQNLREVQKAIARCGPQYYATQYIDKAREYRVFVLQNHIIGVTERFPANAKAPAWNFALGGSASAITRKNWPIDICKLGIKAANLIGLDFAAVDIIEAADKQAYVLEVNTAPGLAKNYRIAQVATALAWLDTNDTPKITKGNTWQTLIHPSLRNYRILSA